MYKSLQLFPRVFCISAEYISVQISRNCILYSLLIQISCTDTQPHLPHRHDRLITVYSHPSSLNPFLHQNMASRKFTKPISNEPSSSGWPGSGMSYTLANALASRRNSHDRQIEYTGPVSSANTAVYSKFVPEEASLSRFGGGLQVAQGIKRSRSEDEYHDERYYQVT